MKKRSEYPDNSKAARARRLYAILNATARRLGFETWQKMGTSFRQAAENADSPDEAQAAVAALLAEMMVANSRPPEGFYREIGEAIRENPPVARQFKKDTPM